MFIGSLSRCLAFGLLLLVGTPIPLNAQTVCNPVPIGNTNGVCQSTIKAKCFNQCAIDCKNDGQCIFGCMVGQDFTPDRCYSNCNGFGPQCLESCLKTIDCIDGGCNDVTQALSIKSGPLTYNRATGLWQRAVVITNSSCTNLGSIKFLVDAIAAGWTLKNADGATTLGVGYKTIQYLKSLDATTVVLEFARAGTAPLTYTTRATGEKLTP